MRIDLGAGLELVDSIGNYCVARVHSALDRGKIALRRADGDAALHTVSSGLTTYTKFPCGLFCTAAVGTSTVSWESY